MKALDLFCGLGGWSDGLALEGFEVLGVEIDPKIAKQYKHNIIVDDIKNIEKLYNFYKKQFHNFDLIVGSPPCRDFSIFAKRFGSTWKKNPPNPKKGLELIQVFLNFIKKSKPSYWLMENVPGLIPYLNIKSRFTTCLGPPEKQQMRRTFWGNFPYFLIPIQHNMKVARFRPEVGRQAKRNSLDRSKIPLPIARALGKAVKEQLR